MPNTHPHMRWSDKECYEAGTSRDPRFDGAFFACVSSTGIYCRPVLPGDHADAGKLLFRTDGGGGKIRLSSLPALPARDRAGVARMDGQRINLSL